LSTPFCYLGHGLSTFLRFSQGDSQSIKRSTLKVNKPSSDKVKYSRRVKQGMRDEPFKGGFTASRFDNKSRSCSVATSGHFSTVGIFKYSSKNFRMTNHGLHMRSLSQNCEGKD